MILGVIADDFTGASDVANVLAKGGMHTIQFNGVPNADVPACDAGIVALKSRSIPADEAVNQSLAALEWLQAQGCTQFLFKYCSTFDSTPDGNIGPVAAALLKALNTPCAIVCPAYPTLNRSIYQGHLFIGDQLLNNSGMENHPITPMTDANLVRWLQNQTDLPVGLIDITTISKGHNAVQATLKTTDARLLVCDCIEDANLLTLGLAVADMPLITGGSGIAIGLPEIYRGKGMLAQTTPPPKPPKSAAIILSGSCSTTTRLQVAEHAKTNPVLQLNPGDVVTGKATPEMAMKWVSDQEKSALPLIFSSAEPDTVTKAQLAHGIETVSGAIETFFGDLACLARDHGIHQIITAGGETSSAVVAALKVDAMQIGPEIDLGVPVLVTTSEPQLALALKSGNFGAPDFFEKAKAAFDGDTHEP